MKKQIKLNDDVWQEVMLFKIQFKAKNASETIKLAMAALREKMEESK